MQPKQATSYIMPALQAVLLHIAVLGIVLVGWNVQSEPAPPPIVIANAKVLTMEDPVLARKRDEEKKTAQAAQQRLAEEKAKQRAEAQRQEERRKAEQQRVAQERKAEEAKVAKQREQEQARKRDEARRAKEEQERIAAQRRIDELAKQQRAREQEIAQALARESALQESASEQEMAQSYAGLIQNKVRQNWSRPLSARNGMQAILVIHFIPTGEVTDVYINQSSGDSAFDNSAVLAVRRMGKVEELQQLSPRVFDKNFRQLRILFRPEDLDR